jgi:hypothetical protein
VEVLERELAHESAPQVNSATVHLPLIPSKRPGSLDLDDYDFDDLLI